MAYRTGTASDYLDFYNTLINFLTSDPELVAEGQNWDVAWQPDSNSLGDNGLDIVLVGPGLASGDQVYIGLRCDPDVLNDSTSIKIVGMTGVLPSAENYDEHVNVSPNPVQFFVRGNNPVDYWFSANGRRIVGCVQTSTVYEGFYAGLFLPYGDPTQYSYPLCIGGTAGATTTTASEPEDWRDVTLAHSNFHRPERNSSGGNSGYDSSLQMLDPAGVWRRVSITFSTDQNVFLTPWNFVNNAANWDISNADSSQKTGYAEAHSRIIQTFDEDFVLTPIALFYSDGSATSAVMFGVFEGAYHVAGRGNSAENIINAEGLDHIAFPNVFRTGIDQFWAMVIGFPEDSNSLS